MFFVNALSIYGASSCERSLTFVLLVLVAPFNACRDNSCHYWEYICHLSHVGKASRNQIFKFLPAFLSEGGISLCSKHIIMNLKPGAQILPYRWRQSTEFDLII